ncbi:hypothetical protein NDU88_006648 [Pleurodeles waltl]|uniref:Uncharacterized protein n=1 Tax=Pleurodeles waltl TaxID=8319 RepID=A0AAV7MGI1_PLEWA|nr:hypothetical protein NDU88_006648 [Pleurodeles waltl]
MWPGFGGVGLPVQTPAELCKRGWRWICYCERVSGASPRGPTTHAGGSVSMCNNGTYQCLRRPNAPLQGLPSESVPSLKSKLHLLAFAGYFAPCFLLVLHFDSSKALALLFSCTSQLDPRRAALRALHVRVLFHRFVQGLVKCSWFNRSSCIFEHQDSELTLPVLVGKGQSSKR